MPFICMLLSKCFWYGHCNTSYKYHCIKILSNFFFFIFPQQEFWKAICTTDFCQKIRVHLFTSYNCLSSQQIVLWLWHKALNLDKAARLTPLKKPTPPSGGQVLSGWIWLGGQAAGRCRQAVSRRFLKKDGGRTERFICWPSQERRWQTRPRWGQASQLETGICA